MKRAGEAQIGNNSMQTSISDGDWCSEFDMVLGDVLSLLFNIQLLREKETPQVIHRGSDSRVFFLRSLHKYVPYKFDSDVRHEINTKYSGG